MTNTEKQIVAVVGGTVLVDGIPRRLAEFADGSGQVQSWRNGHWVPGGCDVKDVLMGTNCDSPGAAR